MKFQRNALLALGRALQAAGYRFVAPTPLTYARYNARPRRDAASPLVEVFGWNRIFQDGELDSTFQTLLEDAGLLERMDQGALRSLVRFSTIADLLFVHSGFPTVEPDAVFFGPDTYRFADSISRLADSEPGFAPQTIFDVATGSGAGGIYAGSLFPSARDILMTDINPGALAIAEVNAALNGRSARTCRSDILKDVSGKADLIISNPPYLVDAAHRTYRHGGGDWGCDLAACIVEEALGRLTDGGQLLLYTGTPIVGGVDKFLEAVQPLLRQRVRQVRYRELDPDVFGEELEQAPYDLADRIAIVVLHVKAEHLIR